MRKITKIIVVKDCSMRHRIIALCDDFTFWECDPFLENLTTNSFSSWRKLDLSEIPQGEGC